jgi:deoxyribodipyrimidine photolyase-related protein
MSQFADGGLMSSKPYVASGRYIQRMSNYCRNCRFDPAKSAGETACPFTTLYWDFLVRHEQRFENHPRAGMQWRNLGRLGPEERLLISNEAEKLKSGCRTANRHHR